MTADRRGAIRLAALALLAPALSPLTGRAAEAWRFAPPAGPMLYTRKIERELRGGARLVATRAFTVRFTAADGGFLVDGEPLAVTVEAPDELAEFARMERERRETALFPLRLDAAGQIADGPATAPSPGLDQAVDRVLARLKDLPLSDDEQLRAAQFVAALQQSAAQLVTELPADLFAPLEAERHSAREVALPDGERGTVSVTYTALADPLTGLLREARREVVTELPGSRRTTRESWTLAPA